MELEEAYNKVIEHIMAGDDKLLLGHFDPNEISVGFMYGVEYVIERLGAWAGPIGETFVDTFNDNYVESLVKASKIFQEKNEGGRNHEN